MDIPGNPQVLQDTPQGMYGPEGSEPVSIIAYPGYFTLQDGEDVNTAAIDFISFALIDADFIAQAMENVIPEIISNGEEILAYGLFRSTIFNLSIPDQICLFGYCFTPPFAGDDVVTSYSYRLIIYTRPSYQAGAMSIRALGPAAIIAIALALIAVVTVIAGIILMSQGTIKWRDIKDYTHDLITAPGQNVAQSLTGPLIGLGLAITAAAIFLPMVSTSVQAQVPIGPARVGVAAGAGTKPPSGGRRR